MSETAFRPDEILETLERHGVRYVVIDGLAATIHGAPLMTTDADMCPSREGDNIERLAGALRELGARIRAPDVPGGLPFACDAVFLSRIDVALNMITRFGALDVSPTPSATGGYRDIAPRSVPVSIAGHVGAVASLADVICSKEAANREKDRAALPTLRPLLRRLEGGAKGD